MRKLQNFKLAMMFSQNFLFSKDIAEQIASNFERALWWRC
jgi:hypothetical protein